MSKKKLLYIHHIGDIGGASISMVDNINMLIDKYDITILFPKNVDQLLISKVIAIGARVIFYPYYFPKFSYYSGSNGFFSKTLFIESIFNLIHKKKFKNFVGNIECDVIIINTIVLFVLGDILKELHIPKILYIRETFKENFISKCIIKKIERRFTGVISISPYENDYAKFKVPFFLVPDVFLPPEDKIFAFKSSAHPKFNVLFLGGTSYLKGFITIVNSLKLLKQNVMVNVYGNINYRAEIGKFIFHPLLHIKYRKAMKAVKCSHNVLMHGFTNNIAETFISNDLVIFPSTKAHQPRPVIEAGYYRKTALISDFPQTDHFYKAGVNVLKVKPRNSVDLAKKINHLSENPELLITLGDNNFEYTRTYHNFLIVKQKLVSAVCSVIEDYFKGKDKCT